MHTSGLTRLFASTERDIYPLELAAYNSVIANGYFTQAQQLQDIEYAQGDMADHTADVERFAAELAAFKQSASSFDQQFAQYIAAEATFFKTECDPNPLP